MKNLEVKKNMKQGPTRRGKISRLSTPQRQESSKIPFPEGYGSESEEVKITFPEGYGSESAEPQGTESVVAPWGRGKLPAVPAGPPGLSRQVKQLVSQIEAAGGQPQQEAYATGLAQEAENYQRLKALVAAFLESKTASKQDLRNLLQSQQQNVYGKNTWTPRTKKGDVFGYEAFKTRNTQELLPSFGGSPNVGNLGSVTGRRPYVNLAKILAQRGLLKTTEQAPNRDAYKLLTSFLAAKGEGNSNYDSVRNEKVFNYNGQAMTPEDLLTNIHHPEGSVSVDFAVDDIPQLFKRYSKDARMYVDEKDRVHIFNPIDDTNLAGKPYHNRSANAARVSALQGAVFSDRDYIREGLPATRKLRGG